LEEETMKKLNEVEDKNEKVRPGPASIHADPLETTRSRVSY
jgi:hypothetical protein